MTTMRWRSRSYVRQAPGFIEPCIPTLVTRLPQSDDWISEIKFDGYRLTVYRDGESVRVYTKRGADWTARYPRIVEGVRRLKVTSIHLDGEGIVYDEHGMPNFDFIHSRRHDGEVTLAAFDLIELNGEDYRPLPLINRKRRLAKLLAKAPDGLEYVDFLEGEVQTIFEHVCKLGHEGIVLKRKDLPYESGRSRRWLKVKNPDSPAMRRLDT